MSLVSKPYTFSPGATIIAAEHNANFDTLYNDYNGNITNANLAITAAIDASKLDLSTIAQDITFTGTIDFTAATISEIAADYMLLPEQASAPSTAADQGAVYTKDVSGNTELFYRDESDGTEVQLTAAGVVSAVSGVEVFTTGGTFTAPVGVTQVFLTMVGGGGGSAGAKTPIGPYSGGGGGGGQSLVKYPYTVTPSTGYTVVVGAGGAALSAGANSTFDGTVIALGGGAGATGDPTGLGGIGGGAWALGTHGRTGGSTTTSTGGVAGGYGIPGGDGGSGQNGGGGGGGTIFGPGAAGTAGGGGNGVAGAANTGAGAGGAGQTTGTYVGAAGGSGIVIVEY